MARSWVTSCCPARRPTPGGPAKSPDGFRFSARSGRARAVAVKTPAPSRARRWGSVSAWASCVSLRMGSASQAGSTTTAWARVRPASYAVMRLPRRRERHSRSRPETGGRGWVPSSQRRAVVGWTVRVRPCSAATFRIPAARRAGLQPAVSSRRASRVLGVRGTAASQGSEQVVLRQGGPGNGTRCDGAFVVFPGTRHDSVMCQARGTAAVPRSAPRPRAVRRGRPAPPYADVNRPCAGPGSTSSVGLPTSGSPTGLRPGSTDPARRHPPPAPHRADTHHGD